MELAFLILAFGAVGMFALVLGLWGMIVSLRQRVRRAEVELAELDQNVTTLSHRAAHWARSDAAPARPSTAPPLAAPVTSPAPTPAGVPAPAAPSAPESPSPSLVAATTESASASTATSASAPASAPADEATADTWESVVGGNWFNKIGATVLVIGIAYSVGYSMTTLGPAGRVAMGLVASLSLLAAGVILERRPAYRNYAYGLIAGGWSGTYFTTYAMHGVESARIVDSSVLATASLAAVAVGMVAHSLRYRSRTVTGLAYLVAFATLVISPFTNFSLVASVPLAASLILVSHRLGWTGISALGISATYLLFAIRSQTDDGGVFNETLPPYLMLAGYWVVFEALDIMARRTSGATPRDQAALFSLNAMGFLGASMTLLPPSPEAFSNLAGVSALAYLVSAVVRATLTPAGPDSDPGEGEAPGSSWTAFTTQHAAVALSAVLAMAAIGARYDGLRATGGLFMVSGMLFTSGLALKDRIIRHFGAVVAAVVLGQVLSIGDRNGTEMAIGPVHLQRWSIVGAVLTASWYLTREWLRVRRLPLEALEHGYTWAASWIALTILLFEFTGTNVVVGSLLLSAALVEVGVRRDDQYRYQGYAIGVLAVAWLSLVFLIDADSVSQVRTVTTLGIAVAIGYGLAVRLAPRFRIDAGVFATFGTYALGLLEFRALPDVWIGPALAATAIALIWLGGQRREALLRWHAVPMFVAAATAAMRLVVQPGPDLIGGDPATLGMLVGAGATAVLIWIGTLVWRQALGSLGAAAEGQPPPEEIARLGLSALAAAMLAIGIADEAPSNAITLLWGLEGVLLLACGFPARERVLRLAGIAVLFLAIGRVFLVDMPGQEGLARAVPFLALGAFLLGVSAVYTRYRDQIRRYL